MTQNRKDKVIMKDKDEIIKESEVIFVDYGLGDFNKVGFAIK